MSTRFKVVQALVIAAMAAGGCGSQAQEQEQRATPQKKAGEAPATTVPPDKEKEKRGNTPPGKDRAGDGPASGAIVDPAGVIKQ